ncbi:MAG: MMPL family transporter [Myxococcales bacterium]|nr:MMPL family transporter [Myxococcales bacterium]
MLITARAISHSVQFVERFYEEYEDLGDKDEACIRSMAELLLPGTMAILTDCVGLLTIALATIPLIEKLGLLCAFWAASIAVTEMLLNRLLILYLPPPRERERRVPALAARILRSAGRWVSRPASATATVAGFALVVLGSFLVADQVPVGDNRPGTPILYPDSEFNVAAAEIGQRFFGLDELLVVAHSDAPGRVFAPDGLKHVEALQRVLETDPAAGGSVSLVDLFKQTSRLFHNNDPRWAIWLQTTAEVTGFQYLLETSVPAQGVLDPYRAQDGESMSVRVFYKDHRAQTVARADELLTRFAEQERIEGPLAVRLVTQPLGALRRLLGPLLPRPLPELSVTVPEAAGERRALPVEAVNSGLTRARWLESGGIGRGAELRSGGLYAPYELWIRRHADAPWEKRSSGVWLPGGIELRVAAGTMGVLAAAHQEIEASHRAGLLVVFAATFLIIALSYRSLLVGALLTLSLGTAAVAALAVQGIAGIGINVNTLPVQAIGVGIGVDYAIYIVDRVREELRRGLTREDALARAVETTGLAIAFTATTLLAGIIFWIPISSLRFSADMSLLLSVLMGVNAIAAILLVPSLLRLVPERWILPRRG